MIASSLGRKRADRVGGDPKRVAGVLILQRLDQDRHDRLMIRVGLADNEGRLRRRTVPSLSAIRFSTALCISLLSGPLRFTKSSTTIFGTFGWSSINTTAASNSLEPGLSRGQRFQSVNAQVWLRSILHGGGQVRDCRLAVGSLIAEREDQLNIVRRLLVVFLALLVGDFEKSVHRCLAAGPDGLLRASMQARRADADPWLALSTFTSSGAALSWRGADLTQGADGVDCFRARHPVF